MTSIVVAQSPSLEHWTFPSTVPTMATSMQSRISTSSEAFRRSEKVPVELKHELGFGMKTDRESLLHQQYLSDEEGLSPIEHEDTLSVEEDSDDYELVDFDENLAELAITYEYTAKACTEALVVSIKPVRPRMVDVSHSSFSVKSPTDNKTLSKSSSLHDSPVEPISTSERHARRSLSSSHSSAKRLSSVPLMESAAEARAVSAVYFPPSGTSGHPSFLDSDPFSRKSPVPRPASSTHSRLRSLSKTISIAKFAAKKPNDAIRSPTTPAKMSEAGSRMKLVPRGAGERAPVLQLPDFPDELDSGMAGASLDRSDTQKYWPERIDSKERRPKPKLRKRKSLVFGE